MRLRQHVAFLVVMSLLSSSIQAQNENRNALNIRLLQWAVAILQVGFYRVYVKPGNHDIETHTSDITRICGKDALGSTFDQGYIVETNQACIALLKLKGWVFAAQPLPK